MRVLLAVHAFPPRSTAGVEVYALRQARALADLGQEVLVLTAVHDLAASPYSLRRRVHQGIEVAEVVSVHPAGTLEATFRDPEMDAAIRPLLEGFRPELLSIHHLLNLSVGLIAEAKSVGARVVFTLHDYWLSCPRDGLRFREDGGLCETPADDVCASCMQRSPYLVPQVQRRLSTVVRRLGLGRTIHRLHGHAPRVGEVLLRILRAAAPPPVEGLANALAARRTWLLKALDGVDLFLAPTRFIKQRTEQIGIPGNRILVSPLGAIVGTTTPRPPGPRRRLGFIGTLAPHKGPHLLVEAFAGLRAAGGTLTLHGSPNAFPWYSDRLRKEAARDRRVRFCGAFPDGDQEAVLSGLDLLVTPSLWWENSPLTILEALGAGVAVVASRTGGVGELVDEGRTGVLVPPGDVDVLRDTLRRAVEGRILAEALPALDLKTAHAAALELLELSLARQPVAG